MKLRQAARIWSRRAAACAVAATVGGIVGCATNPATGHREISLMSEQQEIALGQQSDAEIRREMGVYNDPELQRYIEGIGMRLARVSERPNLPWHFTIVDEPAINAFALPGGYIYITRGILPFLHDEAQLAGVLGHETGHVTARHSVQQYTKATSAGIGVTLLGIFVPETRPLEGVTESAVGLLFLKYGRNDELQADGLGVRYSARAGWDPAGVAGMLTTLQRLDEADGTRKGVPNWLSTHPAAADRVERVQSSIQEASASIPTGGKITGEAEFLQHIDGIIYGDSPSEGIVRDKQFLHPDLRIGVRFPEGWDVRNTRTQVIAKAGERNHYILLQPVQNPRGSVDQIARSGMANAGFREVSGERTTINGLDAYVGTYRGRLQGLGNVVMLTSHIVHEGRVYLLAGIAPPDEFQSVQPQFTSCIRSFRGLTRAEAENIRPDRVDLYTVRAGDTWQSVAELSGGRVKPATLAIMNGYEPAQQPCAGERIKVVVSG